MKQKVFSIIPIIAHSVVICLTSVFSSCKQESDDPAVGNDSSAILTIRINPGDAMNPAYRTPSTRTGEEYEPDKWPANDKEKMHTVRIMIINSDGIVEHNSLWDLTISPDIVAMGQDYTVSANDTKHIIIIANEATATITLPEGKKTSASDYFKHYVASVGSFVDLSEFKSITYATADNNSGEDYDGCIHGPLAMSAIHEYHIGDSGHYTVTLPIHRAAVKYTYRITNLDNRSHNVDYIKVNNIASRQYFFPDADFTDESQYFHTAYRTPDNSGASEITLHVNKTVYPGETAELPSFYFPEGTVTGENNPYQTAFAFDGIFTGWRILKWAIPQFPDQTVPMSDLPRNTHVIVNVSFNYSEFFIDYTVCPWNTQDNIIIPPFN